MISVVLLALVNRAYFLRRRYSCISLQNNRTVYALAEDEIEAR